MDKKTYIIKKRSKELIGLKILRLLLLFTMSLILVSNIIEQSFLGGIFFLIGIVFYYSISIEINSIYIKAGIDNDYNVL